METQSWGKIREMIEIPEGPFEPTWESLRNYKVPD